MSDYIKLVFLFVCIPHWPVFRSYVGKDQYMQFTIEFSVLKTAPGIYVV